MSQECRLFDILRRISISIHRALHPTCTIGFCELTRLARFEQLIPFARCSPSPESFSNTLTCPWLTAPRLGPFSKSYRNESTVRIRETRFVKRSSSPLPFWSSPVGFAELLRGKKLPARGLSRAAFSRRVS